MGDAHERSLARRQGRRGAADAGVRPRLQLLPLPGGRGPDRPSSCGSRNPPPRRSRSFVPSTGSTSRCSSQFADYVGDTLTRRARDQSADPRAGLGRDQGGDPVDAAAGRHRHPVRDDARRLDGGGGRDQAREEDRRRLTRLQPVHLLGARVLDRDHPDPRLRGGDPDIPGGPADDPGRRVLELDRARRSTCRPSRVAGDSDDAAVPRPVLPDHALVDGRRADRGLHHRQARDRPALAPGREQATRSRTRCCRWSRSRRSSSVPWPGARSRSRRCSRGRAWASSPSTRSTTRTSRSCRVRSSSSRPA